MEVFDAEYADQEETYVSPSGIEILEYVNKYLDYFAHWPTKDTRLAVALWAIHTHFRDESGVLVWNTTPRIWFQSAEPESGKSWAMAVTSFICPKSDIYIEPSEPAVIHTVGKEHGTLFLDECDILLQSAGRKVAVRAIANGGYTKIPPTAWPRVRNGQVEKIPTFGALGLAGLESLESGTNGHMRAFLTRCIRVRMERAPKGYSPPDMEDEWETVGKLRKLIANWAAENLDDIKSHKPDMPEGVGNRLAQLWRPLLTVADRIGGDIPKLARKACVSLTKSATNGMCAEVASQTARELTDMMAHWDSPREITSDSDKPIMPDLSRFRNIEPEPEADKTDTASTAPSIPLPTDTRGRLLDTLENAGRPLDGQTIAERAGIPYGNVRVTLGRMRDAGDIMQPARGIWDIPGRTELFSVNDRRAR